MDVGIMIIDIGLLNLFIKDTESKPSANKFFKNLLESEKVIIIQITEEYNHIEMSLKVIDGILIKDRPFNRDDIIDLDIDTVNGDFDTSIVALNNKYYDMDIEFDDEHHI